MQRAKSSLVHSATLADRAPATNRLLLIVVTACLVGAFEQAGAASCADIERWLDWGEPVIAKASKDPYGGTYADIAPMYAGEQFVALAGKPFMSMSDRQRRKLGLKVRKCSDSKFVQWSLAVPLLSSKRSRHYGEFVDALASVGDPDAAIEEVARASKAQARKVAEARQRNAEREARESRPQRLRPHSAGDVIAETASGRLYFSQHDTHADPRRCGFGRSVNVSFVIREGLADEAILSEAWMQPIFDQELLPVVTAVCSGKQDLYADINIEGVHFNQHGEDTTAAAIAGGRSSRGRFGHVYYTTQSGVPGSLDVTGYQGSFNSENDALRTLAGFRAQRERDWRSAERFAEDEARREAQIAMTGAPVEDRLTWTVLADEDREHAFFNSREDIWLTSQAYGRAALAVCGDRIPGGMVDKTFVLSAEDRGEYQRETVRIPADFGHAAHNHIGGQYEGFAILYVFDGRAKEGPKFDAVAGILRRNGCMSEIHRRYHRNLLALAKRHTLTR